MCRLVSGSKIRLLQRQIQLSKTGLVIAVYPAVTNENFAILVQYDFGTRESNTLSLPCHIKSYKPWFTQKSLCNQNILPTKFKNMYENIFDKTKSYFLIIK